MSSVLESRQTPPAATGGVWPARDDERDPYYWKREPVAEQPWLGRGFLREYLRLHDVDGEEPEGELLLAGARRLRWLPRGGKSAWDRTLDLIDRLASDA